jgi:phosphatidylglycerol:prolipoprotein diacylglycerol transferase
LVRPRPLDDITIRPAATTGAVGAPGRQRVHDDKRGRVIYPELVRIGDFEITTFGLMVGVAGLVGLWLFNRERRWSGLPERTLDAAMAGLVGGLAGAKLAWAIEHVGRQGVFLDLLLSRGGLSWFGGFAGGLAAGLTWLYLHRIPVLPVLAAATPSLAVAHAIGRVGCFLVGDDYGLPSDLPWAIAFPRGLPPTTTPVHPTQLYEILALLPIAWALVRWRRQRRADAFVLGAYLMATGSVRFFIEFLRMRESLWGPFAVAHVFSLMAVCVGVALAFRAGSSHDGDTVRPSRKSRG